MRDTRLRKAVCIGKKIAISLQRLKTGNSSKCIGKSFLIAKSTTIEIANQFCESITNIGADFIRFTKTDKETTEAIIEIKELHKCKIPQI